MSQKVKSEPTTDSDVQTLDALRAELNRLNGITRLSWRKIAAMPKFQGISFGTLSAIAKGREPKDPEHRRILKLPPLMVETEPCQDRDCPDFGKVHKWDCRTQVVKPKPKPARKKTRKPYKKIDPSNPEQVGRQIEKYMPGYQLIRKGE